MSGKKVIEFWFDFASTYSYLSAMRIEPLATDAGFEVRWKPFLLGPIFASQGWNGSPFNIYPAKGGYMWRDMERICADRGLDIVHPEPFPQNSLYAARLTLAAQGEPWHGELCRGIFIAEFADGQNLAAPEVLAGFIEKLGAEPAQWAERMSARDQASAERPGKRGISARGFWCAKLFCW
jgi:2-hydroxychromene-2-carboxylate isomerase